jgi:hypothetical protein
MTDGVLACPTTHKAIVADLSSDPVVMRHAWNKTLRIKCRHCGETHRVSFRDAYVAAVLNGTRIGTPSVTGTEARPRQPMPQQKATKSRRAKHASYLGRK